MCLVGALLEKLKDGHAINFVKRLLSRAHAIIELGPAESMPFSAVYDREGAQTGNRVAAQHGGQRRFRKLSVGAFRKHSHAGSGAQQTVEGARVGSDLRGEFLSR